MHEEEFIDKTLMYLYVNREDYVSHGKLTEFIKHHGEGIEGTRIERLLETLYKVGFTDKSENKQASVGNNRTFYDYCINSEGIHFVDSLPLGEYKQKPYSYFIKQKYEKGIKEDKRDKYDLLQKEWIYKMRWLPLIISFIALIVAICAYIKK